MCWPSSGSCGAEAARSRDSFHRDDLDGAMKPWEVDGPSVTLGDTEG